MTKYGVDWAGIAGAPDIVKSAVQTAGLLKSAPSSPSVTYDLNQSYYFRSGVDCYCTDRALQLARDYLQGCVDDYIFFQADAYSSDDATFVLLMGDIDEDDGRFTLHDVREVYFKFHTSVIRYDSSGSGNMDFPVLVEGNSTPASIQKSFTFNYYNADLSSVLSLYYGDINDDTSFTHDSTDLVYSSFEGYPHLIEGVQNYAVAAFVVCFAVLAFRLADRIFRRVY